MLDKLIKSPASFFDTNPVGRILNRFSNDVGVLDYFLPVALQVNVEGAFNFTGIFITVWVTAPFAIIPTVC
eukprot:CAMPEP_0114597136 /NCGR_PEP_ID=MMETSP0125-20121206/19377_1 /TAXON_ID=485358 ORGANISM="Aristerostoma sp., Strain ATCC 50986" /NCGR_SAMPLE_ID=MMETSP0125 /ASSEMBLY_ACC=CAM_ASM_000245 /LENGTH=70 /DNA_ID=CAMNT_0001801307 /DNA_START=53 /DNA_END=265 /DNA_ORIENTATION=+